MRTSSTSLVEQYYDGSSRRVNLWEMVRPEDFFEDTRQACLKVVKPAMEMALEELRDQAIGAGAYARVDGRRDYRNGYYLRRRLETAIGTIAHLRIPRCRRQALIQDLRRYLARAKGKVETQVVAMFLKGVSTRQVGPLLEGLVGVAASPARVSQLARRLDAEVRRFHERRLPDGYAYLFLDGIHLKSRTTPRLFQKMGQARRRVALVAYGVTHEGYKELIGFRLEPSESAAGWGRFLGSLVRRGLTGDRLRVVVTDGGQGVLSAARDFFPDAKLQRCWFHKMSNVFAKVRKRHAAACLQGLRQVYTAPSRRAAERAYVAWSRRWAREEPRAVRCVEQDLEVLLTFYAFPRAHWKLLRTTNAIERCFREVRRRTRSIGCFIDDASIQRIIYGLFDFMNRKRAGKVCQEFRAAILAA